MSQFKWNKKKHKVLEKLAEGYTIKETADEFRISSRTINRWKNDISFVDQLNKMTLMVGQASSAGRMQLIKRAIRQSIKEDGEIETERDIYDWIKLADQVTDGIKLHLTTDLDTFIGLARGGQSRPGQAPIVGNK